jgi:hypothetical protein
MFKIIFFITESTISGVQILSMGNVNSFIP